jgi:hypothetical protein
MSQIKALQTQYQGYHFRSRLEARWAVMLDAAGVKWQYEHEGYECYDRLGLTEATFAYLPDFRLPQPPFTDAKYGIENLDPFSIVEVKGEWTEDAVEQFLNAVASLGTCRNDDDGVNALIAGPLDGTGPWAPWQLHFHKGDLLMRPCPRPNAIAACIQDGICIAQDTGPTFWRTGWGLDTISVDYETLAGLVHLFQVGARPEYWKYLATHLGHYNPEGTDWDYWGKLRDVGRSARFEHGEKGRTL